VQDRYAGDIGDFSKFALARILAKLIGGKTGLIWYRFPDEVHNNDGRHINYLSRPEWIEADTHLVQSLQAVVSSGDRSIKALEQQLILPDSTTYVDTTAYSEGDPTWSRSVWFQAASEAVSGCDLIVVDPDNGIAGPNHAPNGPKGGKHITLDEIKSLAKSHRCLVIYHHFDRSTSHEQQIELQIVRLRFAMPRHTILALRYLRFSPRAYFVVYDTELQVQLDLFTVVIEQKPWDFHFTVHT
jgi:hypothetical protein